AATPIVNATIAVQVNPGVLRRVRSENFKSLIESSRYHLIAGERVSEAFGPGRYNSEGIIPPRGAMAFSCTEPALTRFGLPKRFDSGGDPRGEHNQGICHDPPQVR